ncbi:MAG TPA: tetratricopeptide repeat protein [Polyangiaceae bacterium]|nr:tetratricopeptide repeat protein [Polyangiaceae bacterium]
MAAAKSVDIEQARSAFNHGIELAKEGRWVDALAELSKSNALRPHAVTTYNIGYCERSLGRYTRARKMLAKALLDNQASGGQELPDDLIAAATNYLSETEQQIATIRVSIAPETAMLKVDGRPLELVSKGNPRPVASAGTRDVGVAEAAPAASFDLLIDPGTHEFVIQTVDQSVTVLTHTFKPGSREAVQLTAQQPPPLERTGASQTGTPRKPHRTPAWIAFGVAGTGAVVGSVSGALAFTQKGPIADACPDDPSCAEKRRTGNREADIATAGFIVAGAGVIVGTILLVTAGAHDEPHTGSKQAKHFVRPFVGAAVLGIEAGF